MPIKFGTFFEPDALDNQMKSRGWLDEVTAADQLGVPLTALRNMADCHEITLNVVKGRRYFEKKSVDAHLARFGYPSADERRLAYLDSLPPERSHCGTMGQERLEIIYRMQERATAQNRAMGAYSADSEPASATRDLPADPGEAFVRKYGGGA